jgi:hypothetical protein
MHEFSVSRPGTPKEPEALNTNETKDTKDDKPKRTTSSTSTSSIFRRSLGSMLGPSRSHSPSNLPRTDLLALGEDENRDPLPDDKRDLEALLNHHLAELDRLRRNVKTMNGMILEHELRLTHIMTREISRAPLSFLFFSLRPSPPGFFSLSSSTSPHSHPTNISIYLDMLVALTQLERQLHDTREARNAFGKYIGFHRMEIERITNKRLAQREAAHEPLTVPPVVTNLPNDWEWKQLFLV